MKNLKKIVIITVIYLISTTAAEAVNNDRPVAVISANVLSVYACENFNLKSKSIDKDGFIAHQEWTLNQGGKNIFLGSQPEIILGLPYTRTVGDLEVSLEVTDNSNDPATNKDTKTIRLYTKPNPAPRIDRIDKSAFPNNRGSFYPGEKFWLNAVMSADAIMRSATIKWNYDKNIFRFSSDTIANPEVAVLSAPQAYEYYSLVSAEATNACGEKEKMEISIPVKQIPANSPPKAKLVISGSANENTEFWLSSAGSTTGNGYNEPEDSLTYSWSCNRQGIRENMCASGGSAVLVRFPDGGILIEVSLKICDESGACDSANSSVFIEETEDDPPIADASVTARTAYSGENFSLNCSLSKDDRDAMDMGVQYCRWKLTTTIVDSKGKALTVVDELPPTRQRVLSYKFNVSGIWNAELRVSDGAMHLSDPNTIQINVLKGTAPSVEIIGTTPVSVPAAASQAGYAAPIPLPSVTPKKELPPFVAPPQKTNAISAFTTLCVIVFAYIAYRQKNK